MIDAAYPMRFINNDGTQGRIMMWNPASIESKKALPSSHPELLARFLKESSVCNANLHPDIDHIDLQARQENLQVRGDPVMLQLSVTPCYASPHGRRIVHKLSRQLENASIDRSPMVDYSQNPSALHQVRRFEF